MENECAEMKLVKILLDSAADVFLSERNGSVDRVRLPGFTLLARGVVRGAPMRPGATDDGDGVERLAPAAGEGHDFAVHDVVEHPSALHSDDVLTRTGG